jgi:hypothetical protein
VSTFTFLNFLAASLSLAGTLASNTNSNNNNNNNNNNENNNNDININIGNNNNNANSNNAIMFLPMVGRGLAVDRRAAVERQSAVERRAAVFDERHPFQEESYVAELCGRTALGEQKEREKICLCHSTVA